MSLIYDENKQDWYICKYENKVVATDFPQSIISLKNLHKDFTHFKDASSDLINQLYGHGFEAYMKWRGYE